MFSIKLNAPVLLRKQLPVIAKALHVDEKVLDDFMTVSTFYGVKDGKGTIVPIKKTDTIVHIDYKAYDNYYFVVDAIPAYISCFFLAVSVSPNEIMPCWKALYSVSSNIDAERIASSSRS